MQPELGTTRLEAKSECQGDSPSWTWKMKWKVAHLLNHPYAGTRTESLYGLMRRAGRGGSVGIKSTCCIQSSGSPTQLCAGSVLGSVGPCVRGVCMCEGQLI